MTDIDKDTREKISNMQILDQKLQAFLMQKQGLQSQLLETENALVEIKGAKDVYKIVGNIMINSKPNKLKKELEESKEKISTRIKMIEKQEEKLRKELSELQEEVMQKMKK